MDQEFTKEMFDNVDQFLASIDENETTSSNSLQSKDYDQDLYKKWFRSKTQSGFVSIRPWFEALKFKIDIGKTSSDGKLLSSTNVFVDACDFAAYLLSIANGTAHVNYPSNERMGVPTDKDLFLTAVALLTVSLYLEYSSLITGNLPIHMISHHSPGSVAILLQESLNPVLLFLICQKVFLLI